MKKTLLSLAMMLPCFGAWAQTYDGAYTLRVDENQQRGYVVAGVGYNEYPVLSEITLSGYTQNSVDAIEGGKDWFITTINDGATYCLYNLAVDKFLVQEGGVVNFGENPYEWKFSTNGNYLNIEDTKNSGKFLSGGCGRTAANRPMAFDTNKNDGGAKYTITELDNAATYTTKMEDVKAAIVAYFAGNSIAVEELDAIIANATTLFSQIEIGEGVGKYSSSNANYETDFAAIVTFREGITSNETPTAEEVQAKTAEVQAIINSFELNMPEAGQFLRIKAVEGWNNDARYLGATNSEGRTRAAFIAETDANSIFYFDGNNLISYGSGNYLVMDADNMLGYNGVQANGSKIGFTAASNKLINAYNISFNNGGRWLYVNQGNYTDAGGGRNNANGYCFNLEEVTSLPVNISAAGYATFYAPVDLTLPTGLEAFVVTSAADGYAHLEAIDAIPANTGVLLKGNGAYDLTFATEAVAEVANNMLAGSIASEYVAKNAYVLSNQAEGVGFYKAELNQTGNTFRNKGFKAYLDATADVQVLKFNFGGNTTAIESVVNGLDANAPIYDLSGRRVNAATKGIYIQNGKKFIVK